MALHIPEHAINATPWLISEHDSAWDHARIERECDEHKLAKDEHPYHRYQVGETRYDLEAPFTLPDGATVTMRDYLGEAPARFKLRPLNPDEHAHASDLLVRGSMAAAYTYATRRGLTGIEGIEGVTFKKKRGVVDDKVIDLLHRAGVLLELGGAVMLVSRPMDEAEKK